MIEPNRPSPTLLAGYCLGGIFQSFLPVEVCQQFVVPTVAISGTDQYWMNEALKESLKGIGIANPNPAVGCVLLDQGGQEISRGHTQAFPGWHAERVAFEKLIDQTQLVDGTAYITLEPCSHFGRNPPCVDLLLNSKVRRIVIARGDPNPLVNGEGIKKLLAAGKSVEIGVLENEVSAWNWSFIAQTKLERPVFALKWAQTLDGQLADDLNYSKWISNSASRAYGHWLRQKYDAILVGVGTMLSDYPSLTARDCVTPNIASPLPIIFDPEGLCFEADNEIQIRLNETTFHESRKVVLITKTEKLNKVRTSWLFHKENTLILTISGTDWKSEILGLLQGSLITQLLGHEIQSIFVEGGPQTLTTFLKAGLADILHIFIAPTISGGLKNRIYLKKDLLSSMKFDVITQSLLGDNLLIELASPEISPIFQKKLSNA